VFRRRNSALLQITGRQIAFSACVMLFMAPPVYKSDSEINFLPDKVGQRMVGRVNGRGKSWRTWRIWSTREPEGAKFTQMAHRTC